MVKMGGFWATEHTEDSENSIIFNHEFHGLARIVEWIMEMGGCLTGEGAIYYMKAV